MKELEDCLKELATCKNVRKQVQNLNHFIDLLFQHRQELEQAEFDRYNKLYNSYLQKLYKMGYRD